MWWLWVGIMALVALLIYVALHAFSTSTEAPVAKADQGIGVDANGWHKPTESPQKASQKKAAPVPTVTLQGYAKPVPTITTARVRTDPRYPTCAEANAAGYGNYHRGDPEYGWYRDADHDGVACEFTAPVVKPNPVPTVTKTVPAKPVPTVTKIITACPTPTIRPTVTVTISPAPSPSGGE